MFSYKNLERLKEYLGSFDKTVNNLVSVEFPLVMIGQSFQESFA